MISSLIRSGSLTMQFYFIYIFFIQVNSIQNPSWSFHRHSPHRQHLISRLHTDKLTGHKDFNEAKLSTLFSEDRIMESKSLDRVKGFENFVNSIFDSNMDTDDVIFAPEVMIARVPAAFFGSHYFIFVVESIPNKNSVRIILKSPESNGFFSKKKYTIVVDLKRGKNILKVSIRHSLNGLSKRKVKYLIQAIQQYIENRIRYETQKIASRKQLEENYQQVSTKSAMLKKTTDLDKVIHPERYRTRPGKRGHLDSSEKGSTGRFKPGSATQERRQTRGG